MKSVEYVVKRLEDAVNDYETSDNDIEQIEAVVELNLLKDLLDPHEIPEHLQLRMYCLAVRMYAGMIS